MNNKKTFILEEKLERALYWVIDVLTRNDIDYQISGGFAAHIYGANRPINDIDIDIPEDRFEDVYNDVKDYIIFGPGQFKDERWDLKMITLNYKGQEIDIGGAYETKICDINTGEWVTDSADLSTVKIFYVNGLKINVCNPRDLASYKKMLKGEHQKNDVQAVENYLRNETIL